MSPKLTKLLQAIAITSVLYLTMGMRQLSSDRAALPNLQQASAPRELPLASTLPSSARH